MMYKYNGGVTAKSGGANCAAKKFQSLQTFVRLKLLKEKNIDYDIVKNIVFCDGWPYHANDILTDIAFYSFLCDTILERGYFRFVDPIVFHESYYKLQQLESNFFIFPKPMLRHIYISLE